MSLEPNGAAMLPDGLLVEPVDDELSVLLGVAGVVAGMVEGIVVDGVVGSVAGIVPRFAGIVVAPGVVVEGAASLVVVCAKTNPAVPTIVSAAAAEANTLDTFMT